MSLFFPDLNVWLALSAAGHVHSADAWRWLNVLPARARVLFCRYTQIGLLRLLANQAVMGEQTLTLKQAWHIYDRWLADPRVEFYPEPRGLDAVFRRTTEPFAKQRAARSVGDCYLLSYAIATDARLVTFDKALVETAKKQDHSAILPQ